MFEGNALKNNARITKIQYSSFALKMIAAIMTVIGTIGVAILQNAVLGLDTYSTNSLLESLNTDSRIMALTTVIILCSGIAVLALPIYAHILLEGFRKTSSLKKYAMRLLILALISEVPYDLAMKDTWFTMASQNPAWGMLIALIMLYFLRHFENIKGFKGILLRLVILTAAILWMIMLNISYGAGLAMVVAVLWIFEGQGALTTFLGVIASLLYFPAPFGLIFNHFYNGEKGKNNRILFYVLYPVQLMIIGLVGKYLL